MKQALLILFGIGLLFSLQSQEKPLPNDVKALTVLAEKGDAGAQGQLARNYTYGKGVKQNYVEALKWARKAAAQGNSDGQFVVGRSYYLGNAVEKNSKEAVKWYQKAAERGHALAQNNLGVMYANGQGVEQDFKEAVKWYQKAADQGDAYAQSSLGVRYAKGQGVEQNFKEAFKWCQKAADQGVAMAQYNLGLMYAKGQGVEQDFKEAVKWYRKAAEQGDADAQRRLTDLAYKKMPDGKKLFTTVKGIYLGMNIYRAVEELNKRDPQLQLKVGKIAANRIGGVDELLSGKFGKKIEIPEKDRRIVTVSNEVYLEAGLDAQITTIIFHRLACDRLFDTAGLSNEKFFDEFEKAYRLGASRPFSESNRVGITDLNLSESGRIYENPKEGYRVRFVFNRRFRDTTGNSPAITRLQNGNAEGVDFLNIGKIRQSKFGD